MRRSVSLIAIVGLIAVSAAPSFGQGPQPGNGSAGVTVAGPAVPRIKSAGSPHRPSGDTAVSNAPIKSTPTGSNRGPIDVATDECAAGAAADTCPQISKN